jgi:hypothetical protein
MAKPIHAKDQRCRGRALLVAGWRRLDRSHARDRWRRRLPFFTESHATMNAATDAESAASSGAVSGGFVDGSSVLVRSPE